MANVLKNLNSFQVNIWPHLWFGAYMVVFWPKVVPFVRPPLLCWTHWSPGPKMCKFEHKILIFGAKSHLFSFWTAIFSTGHIITTTDGAITARCTHPPKKISFWDTGCFLGLIPDFGHCWKVAWPVILVRYQWKNKNFNGGGRYFGSSKIFFIFWILLSDVRNMAWTKIGA